VRLGRALLIGGLAGFGLALFAMAVYHFWDTGTCANGPQPYAITQRCPGNSTWWFVALPAGFVPVLIARSLAGGEALTGLLLGFGGAASLVALATGAAHNDGVLGAAVVGVVFVAIGGVGLWQSRELARPPAGVLAGALATTLLGALAAVAAAVAIPGPLTEPRPTQASAATGAATGGTPAWFAATLLARELDAARKVGPAARVASVHLAPDQTLIVVAAAGKTHTLVSVAGGAAEDTAGPLSNRSAALFSAVDPQAPARLVAELKRRFGFGADRLRSIDFSLGVVTGRPQWDASLRDGSRVYTSGPHGTGVKRSL
jgi:hypothetical protein